MKLYQALSVTAAIALASLAASASPIQLFPGVAVSEPKNNGDATVAQWVIDTVDAYNSAKGTSFSTANVDPTGHDAGADTPSGPLAKTLPVSEYDYLVLHWGGNTKHGDVTHQLFYLGTCPDGATFEFLAPSGNGLSYYRFFGPGAPPSSVPDGGNSLILLGASALASGWALRRKNRQ